MDETEMHEEMKMDRAFANATQLTTFCIFCCLVSGCAQVPPQADFASFFASQKANQQKKAAANSPQREQLLANARSLEKQGKYEQAIKRYEQITKQFPNEGRAYHRLAVCHDRLGGETDSSSLYLRALHFSPNNPDLLCDYGYSRYVHGDSLQAETMLRRALKIDQSLARGHANLALVLARQGKEGAAIKSFVRSGLSESAAKANLQKLRATQAVPASVPSETKATLAKTTAKIAQPKVEIASAPIVLGEVGVQTDLSEQELLELLTKDAAKSNASYVSEPMRKSMRR